jgi:hypothetical protein
MQREWGRFIHGEVLGWPNEELQVI